MKRIHDSLQRVFERHRLVFWYDATGEWMDAFNGYEGASVTKLRVEGNEFGTKVRVIRNPDPDARFLLYLPSLRPTDAENWLLDLLLQGYEYKADRASPVIAGSRIVGPVSTPRRGARSLLPEQQTRASTPGKRREVRPSP